MKILRFSSFPMSPFNISTLYTTVPHSLIKKSYTGINGTNLYYKGLSLFGL